MTKDPKVALLRGVPLFGTCDSVGLEHIISLFDEVDVPDGYVIAREGLREGQFAIIVDGTVRLERAGKVFQRIGPGQYLGEMALIDDGPRTASAISEGPVKLLVMGPKEFQTLVNDSVAIRASIFENLARRIRHYEPEAAH